jgi:molybdopterin synthase sulfur carrier subunit
MEITYMAWLRKKLGKTREDLSPPPEVDNVQKLIDWLSMQSSAHQSLFFHQSIICVSINGKIARDWRLSPISSSDKINFFSPMAGG